LLFSLMSPYLPFALHFPWSFRDLNCQIVEASIIKCCRHLGKRTSSKSRTEVRHRSSCLKSQLLRRWKSGGSWFNTSLGKNKLGVWRATVVPATWDAIGRRMGSKPGSRQKCETLLEK
jgi:hypothetical protein